MWEFLGGFTENVFDFGEHLTDAFNESEAAWLETLQNIAYNAGNTAQNIAANAGDDAQNITANAGDDTQNILNNAGDDTQNILANAGDDALKGGQTLLGIMKLGTAAFLTPQILGVAVGLYLVSPYGPIKSLRSFK